jgi:hypothetical protein
VSGTTGGTPYYYPLFGPVDDAGALTQIASNVWQWPGSCVTAHCAIFPVKVGLRPLQSMTWRMCFRQPVGRVLFRLVACLNGPTNIVEMAEIDSNNKPPGIDVWNCPVDVTDNVQAYFAANCTQTCSLGFQVNGDHTNAYTLFSGRLEAIWS